MKPAFNAPFTNHSREIRQLWIVAKSYFEEARNLTIKTHEHLDLTLTDIMDFCKNEIPTEEYQIELTLLGAHLNCAAIRLCTINERCREDMIGEITKDYIKELSRNKKRLKDEGHWSHEHLAEELKKNLKEYLPQMLRDSVSHREMAEHPQKGVIWQARQIALESLKVSEVFACMQSAMELFETQLRNSKLIP